MKFISHRPWFHWLLLLGWLLLGAVLRLTNLAAKPPWTDEFATLVYSLGHSFQTVPLNQAISLETLLQPLQTDTQTGVNSVVHYLLSEDNHPPLYFVIAHLWLQWFPSDGGLVSIWAARSLPALFGILSIPMMFGLGWLATGSRLAAHLTAAMMAVSPYGVYLAQEARHYTLGILWVIASVGCLVIAVRSIDQRVPMPIWVSLVWVVVNCLGITTHFFFVLTLGAEFVVLAGLAGWQVRQTQMPKFLWRPYWQRVYIAILGTLVSIMVWVPMWFQVYSNQTTQWIRSDRTNLLSWINPIVQSLAAWITMLVLLPIESTNLSVVTIAGLLMGAFLLWALPVLWRGLKKQWQQPIGRLAIQTFGGFVLGAIAIFFIIAYGLGSDITRGARYNFVYFPGVIALLGLSLTACWHWGDRGFSKKPAEDAANTDAPPLSEPKQLQWGRRAVALILVTGFASGLTVVSNLGYRKYYRPDQLVPIIQERSQSAVLVATTHETLVQTGELMGVAWGFRQRNLSKRATQPQFLLAHIDADLEVATRTLQATLRQQRKPVDLWLLNFHAPVELAAQNCRVASPSEPGIYGYEYQHYTCPAITPTSETRETTENRDY